MRKSFNGDTCFSDSCLKGHFPFLTVNHTGSKERSPQWMQTAEIKLTFSPFTLSKKQEPKHFSYTVHHFYFIIVIIYLLANQVSMKVYCKMYFFFVFKDQRNLKHPLLNNRKLCLLNLKVLNWLGKVDTVMAVLV